VVIELSVLSILLVLTCAICCDLRFAAALRYRRQGMNVKQKVDVGFPDSYGVATLTLSQPIRYAIALICYPSSQLELADSLIAQSTRLNALSILNDSLPSITQ
jgi:hypothetical protein